MKLEMIKDAIVVMATGGALILGIGSWVGKVNEVPKLERRIGRVERQVTFLVQGMEKLTNKKYSPQHEDSE